MHSSRPVVGPCLPQYTQQEQKRRAPPIESAQEEQGLSNHNIFAKFPQWLSIKISWADWFASADVLIDSRYLCCCCSRIVKRFTRTNQGSQPHRTETLKIIDQRWRKIFSDCHGLESSGRSLWRHRIGDRRKEYITDWSRDDWLHVIGLISLNVSLSILIERYIKSKSWGMQQSYVQSSILQLVHQ